MPYLQINLPGQYASEKKRALGLRFCELYSKIMKTQSWRPNVGISELGENNLMRIGANGPEPVIMILVEYRRGRPANYRLELARKLVEACEEILDVSQSSVLVEFTPHDGNEMFRDGNWVADWGPAEAGK